MSSWSQLRNVDSYGVGAPTTGFDNTSVSNLIDMGSLANWGGASNGLSGFTALPEMTRGPMGLGDYASAVGDWFSKSGFMGTPASAGKPGTTGWGMPVISAAQGLMSGYLGMKNYGLAKDQFNFTKDMANKNLANQTKEYNSQLEDRQRARVAANPGASQAVDEYMKQKGI